MSPLSAVWSWPRNLPGHQHHLQNPALRHLHHPKHVVVILRQAAHDQKPSGMSPHAARLHPKRVVKRAADQLQKVVKEVPARRMKAEPAKMAHHAVMG